MNAIEPTSEEILEMWKELRAPIDKKREKDRERSKKRYQTDGRRRYVKAYYDSDIGREVRRYANVKYSKTDKAKLLRKGYVERRTNVLKEFNKGSVSLTAQHWARWDKSEENLVKRLFAQGFKPKEMVPILKRSLFAINGKIQKLKLTRKKAV
jgi:hypothetical protein